jgi:superfamily II DNA/RNA helicase
VRILLTSDIAAEGVNLHRQCHELIHYDIPWSLITIEQRNGRIDRYGQRISPQIRVLLHRSANPGHEADEAVSRKLATKEDNAHRTLGEAAALMGLRDEEAEEISVEEAYLTGRDIDEVVPDEPTDPDDIFMTGGFGETVVPEDVQSDTSRCRGCSARPASSSRTRSPRCTPTRPRRSG